MGEQRKGSESKSPPTRDMSVLLSCLLTKHLCNQKLLLISHSLPKEQLDLCDASAPATGVKCLCRCRTGAAFMLRCTGQRFAHLQARHGCMWWAESCSRNGCWWPGSSRRPLWRCNCQKAPSGETCTTMMACRLLESKCVCCCGSTAITLLTFDKGHRALVGSA